MMRGSIFLRTLGLFVGLSAAGGICGSGGASWGMAAAVEKLDDFPSVYLDTSGGEDRDDREGTAIGRVVQ